MPAAYRLLPQAAYQHGEDAAEDEAEEESLAASRREALLPAGGAVRSGCGG